MQKTFVFPSVIEENYRDYGKIANDFLEAIKIKNFNGKDYIIGDLALKEGSSPHKFLNSSADDLDYQLLGLIGLLIATQGTYSKLIVTTGFPFTTYQAFKQGAIDYFIGSHEISFDAQTLGGDNLEKVRFSVSEVDVLTEVEGSIKAIRDGEINEKDNFFVASIGYGTFEIALSSPGGLIFRTTHSAKGIIYAVSNLENELQKKYYLNLLTDQQIERAFQRGSIIINRKRIDLTDIRARALRSYYSEVISPNIRKKFTDEDFYRAKKFYLVGGGAMFPEIVDCFREEFDGLLDIVVVPDPYLTASKGYCLRSMELAKQKINTLEDKGNYACVGLDLGNNNTVITVNDDF